MKKVLFILGVFISTFITQGQVKISDLKMTNLGDGRLYAEYKDKDDEKEKPVEGKIRIITGYTTEYIDAQFSKGIAEGKWEYYKDNKLSEVMHYTDGLQNGELIRYYNDGKTVREKATMKNGKVNGIATSYSEDGKLTNEKGMKDGVEDGPERRYDKDGKLTYEANFKNGKQEGKSFRTTFMGNSETYTTTEYYKNGKLEGEYKEVYGDGTVRTKGKYIDGKKDGLWEVYKPDGSRKGNTETFKNGVVIKRITYYTDGSVEMERNFNEQGKQHGLEKKYEFDGGELKSEKNFVNGKQVGKQMRLISSNQGNFYEYSVYNETGKKHGEFSEIYVKSKKTKTKGQYANDKKHGKWVYSYESGPYKEEIYDNGKLVETKKLGD